MESVGTWEVESPAHDNVFTVICHDRVTMSIEDERWIVASADTGQGGHERIQMPSKSRCLLAKE
jgi:hypothetical protein